MCTRHGKEHPVTDFPKDKKQHDHLSTWCKLAWREYRAEKSGAPKKAPAAKAAAKPADKKPAAGISKTPAKAKPAKPAKEVN